MSNQLNQVKNIYLESEDLVHCYSCSGQKLFLHMQVNISPQTTLEHVPTPYLYMFIHNTLYPNSVYCIKNLNYVT